jgi:hypothetical protein
VSLPPRYLDSIRPRAAAPVARGRPLREACAPATSPITSLVSTRQHDKDGTIYERTTASSSLYLVSMPDERARQVLGTFYAWKNGAQACR